MKGVELTNSAPFLLSIAEHSITAAAALTLTETLLMC